MEEKWIHAFPKKWMQTDPLRVWTRFADCILRADNCYATYPPQFE